MSLLICASLLAPVVRRRPSRRQTWVMTVPYLLSLMASVCVFHRLEILFAYSAAKLSRFEIFMNGSLLGLGNKGDATSVVFSDKLQFAGVVKRDIRSMASVIIYAKRLEWGRTWPVPRHVCQRLVSTMACIRDL